MSRARMERRAWKKGRSTRAMTRVARKSFPHFAEYVFGVERKVIERAAAIVIASKIHEYVYGRMFDGQRWVKP